MNHIALHDMEGAIRNTYNKGNQCQFQEVIVLKIS